MWCTHILSRVSIFFFNDTATTEIYTLSLHDALPISVETDHRLGELLDGRGRERPVQSRARQGTFERGPDPRAQALDRSEEHTSELQSRRDLVCRLLLEKKKKKNKPE